MKTHIHESEFVICGTVVEDKYNGNNITVSKCEFTYEDEKLSNCIYIQYKFEFFTEEEKLDQEAINKFLITEISILLHLLSLLITRPTQSVVEKTKIDGEVVEIRLPPRRVPRGVYNLAEGFRLRPKQEIKRYAAKINKDCWVILEQLLNNHRANPNLTNNLSLALRWFTKGIDEFSSLDRFIAFWIAFNALYVDETKNEQEAIKACIRTNTNRFMAERLISRGKKLLSRLSSAKVELGRKHHKKVISEELASLLKASDLDYIAILETAVLTIYGIRNKLFHGAYDTNSEDTQEIMSLAEAFISDVIKEMIGYLLYGNPLPKTNFVFEEKVGLG